MIQLMLYHSNGANLSNIQCDYHITTAGSLSINKRREHPVTHQFGWEGWESSAAHLPNWASLPAGLLLEIRQENELQDSFLLQDVYSHGERSHEALSKSTSMGWGEDP